MGFLLNVIINFKIWNNELEESHLDNFYYEREWRTTNNVNFQLEDIVLIIPKNYKKRFKEDFPEY
jgi:hypothetical protein